MAEGGSSQMDGTSRVTGDSHARFCERPGVKFPGPTRRRPAMVVPTATVGQLYDLHGSLRGARQGKSAHGDRGPECLQPPRGVCPHYVFQKFPSETASPRADRRQDITRASKSPGGAPKA